VTHRPVSPKLAINGRSQGNSHVFDICTNINSRPKTERRSEQEGSKLATRPAPAYSNRVRLSSSNAWADEPTALRGNNARTAGPRPCTESPQIGADGSTATRPTSSHGPRSGRSTSTAIKHESSSTPTTSHVPGGHYRGEYAAAASLHAPRNTPRANQGGTTRAKRSVPAAARGAVKPAVSHVDAKSARVWTTGYVTGALYRNTQQSGDEQQISSSGLRETLNTAPKSATRAAHNHVSCGPSAGRRPSSAAEKSEVGVMLADYMASLETTPAADSPSMTRHKWVSPTRGGDEFDWNPSDRLSDIVGPSDTSSEDFDNDMIAGNIVSETFRPRTESSRTRQGHTAVSGEFELRPGTEHTSRAPAWTTALEKDGATTIRDSDKKSLSVGFFSPKDYACSSPPGRLSGRSPSESVPSSRSPTEERLKCAFQDPTDERGKKIASKARPMRAASASIISTGSREPSAWELLPERPPSRQKPPPEALHLFSKGLTPGSSVGLQRPATAVAAVGPCSARPRSGQIGVASTTHSASQPRPPSRQRPPSESRGLNNSVAGDFHSRKEGLGHSEDRKSSRDVRLVGALRNARESRRPERLTTNKT